MELKLDLSKFEGKQVKFRVENGVAIFESEEKEDVWPERGYWVVGGSSEIRTECFDQSHWENAANRNVYPHKNHAILFGQTLAPLEVRH